MFERKTEIKCRGCQKELPNENFDTKTQRPTWFGIYRNSDILDWVCIDCWDKGIKYEGYVDRMSR